MGVIIILYFRSLLFFGTFSTGKSPAARKRHPLTNHVLYSELVFFLFFFLFFFAGELESHGWAHKLRWGKYSFLSPDFSDVITQFAKELVLGVWGGGYGQLKASDVSKLIKAGLPAQGVNGRIHQSSSGKFTLQSPHLEQRGKRQREGLPPRSALLIQSDKVLIQTHRLHRISLSTRFVALGVCPITRQHKIHFLMYELLRVSMTWNWVYLWVLLTTTPPYFLSLAAAPAEILKSVQDAQLKSCTLSFGCKRVYILVCVFICCNIYMNSRLSDFSLGQIWLACWSGHNTTETCRRQSNI